MSFSSSIIARCTVKASETLILVSLHSKQQKASSNLSLWSIQIPFQSAKINKRKENIIFLTSFDQSVYFESHFKIFSYFHSSD
jgi:hypothetical protein